MSHRSTSKEPNVPTSSQAIKEQLNNSSLNSGHVNKYDKESNLNGSKRKGIVSPWFHT